MSFDALGQAWEMINKEPLKTQIGEYIDALLDAFRSVDYVGSGLQTHATLTCMRGLMRVYNIKKDPSLLATIVKYFDDYEKYGMTVNYENRNGSVFPDIPSPAESSTHICSHVSFGRSPGNDIILICHTKYGGMR